jgi:IclR family pca regulon transcriptional regulator
MNTQPVRSHLPVASSSPEASQPASVGVPARQAVMPGAQGDPDFMLSLARGLAVIRAFGEGRQRLSVAEVGRLTNLSRAAARRALYTLSVLGYAKFSNGMYELTPGVTALGRAYLSVGALASLAQPVLERVSAQIHESCSLAVLDGDDVVYLARAAARRIVSLEIAVGSRLPAFCTSLGRVLVAHTDPQSRDRYVNRVKLIRRTPYTIVDKAQFRTELARIHSQGFAVLDQELEIGLRSVAVPVSRAGVVVAAISAGMHVSVADRQIMQRDIVPVLRAAADEIGTALSPQV